MLFSGVTLVKQRDDYRWYCYQQLLIEYTSDLYAMAINWRKTFYPLLFEAKNIGTGRHFAGLSSRVVSASDRGVRGPRFESHCERLSLPRQLLRYAALGTGCALLLQCLGRLSLPLFVGRKMSTSLRAK